MQGTAVGGSLSLDGGPHVVGGAGAGPSGVLCSLPAGRVLQLDLLSTWGDPLCGEHCPRGLGQNDGDLA